MQIQFVINKHGIKSIYRSISSMITHCHYNIIYLSLSILLHGSDKAGQEKRSLFIYTPINSSAFLWP